MIGEALCARRHEDVVISVKFGALRAPAGPWLGHEVGAETVRRVHAVREIWDLQIEYSLISRGIEAAILPTCRQLVAGSRYPQAVLASLDSGSA